MENERREDERARVSIEARWVGQSGQHKARVADLSLGGCFIDTLGQAQVGEFITFAIKQPDGKWLQLRGEVASVDQQTGFSVAFTYLTEDEQIALGRLITI
ncbi:MAG: PilZ domain-containing protein [Acidobacteria bacterium]|nr:PilZ domain-containing protein [Acidobacteriota bacterium]